jgi:sulfofructose kinase
MQRAAEDIATPGGPFTVVGGGAATVDQLLFVDGSIGDGKGRVLRRETRFGGNIATALVAAARAGASCAFLGHLPDDTSGLGLLDRLRAEGVNVEHARTSPETPPIHSVVLVGQDGRRFIAFDDHTVMGLPPDLDLDLVRAARVLILDGYGVTGGLRAASAARAAGVAVIVDMERTKGSLIAKLLGVADHLVLPREAALAWTGAGSPAEAVDALWQDDRAAVVVTSGVDGCWYRSADDPHAGVRHHPALIVDVVDTTGCGDVFHGSYAAALAEGNSIARCVARATAAAAECATRPGGF